MEKLTDREKKDLLELFGRPVETAKALRIIDDLESQQQRVALELIDAREACAMYAESINNTVDENNELADQVCELQEKLAVVEADRDKHVQTLLQERKEKWDELELYKSRSLAFAHVTNQLEDEVRDLKRVYCKA